MRTKSYMTYIEPLHTVYIGSKGLHMFFVSLSLPAIALESAKKAGTSAHGCADEAITRMDATNRRSCTVYYAYMHFLSAIGARLPRIKKYMRAVEPHNQYN